MSFDHSPCAKIYWPLRPQVPEAPSAYTFASVFVFIITMLLLATDFYYLKNIAGRRLVGLRWWNEVDTGTGDSHWVFESQDRSGGTDDNGRERPNQNMTDKRFFWLALYCQPALWIVLGVLAIIKFEFIWLILIGESESQLG